MFVSRKEFSGSSAEGFGEVHLQLVRFYWPMNHNWHPYIHGAVKELPSGHIDAPDLVAEKAKRLEEGSHLVARISTC